MGRTYDASGDCEYKDIDDSEEDFHRCREEAVFVEIEPECGAEAIYFFC